MNIDTKKIVSISEANQNFSRVARMTDKHGELYIFKNNKPKYKSEYYAVESGQMHSLTT